MLRPLPSVDLLRNLLRYEPDTGKLFWRKRTPDMFSNTGRGGAVGCCARWNGKHAEKLALNHLNPDGYFSGNIFGVLRLAHRVAWAMHFENTLFQQIDHQNGVRTDNRIANLRCVSCHENAKNAKIRADNRSGSAGVFRQGGSWIAQIGGGKNRKYLGSFLSFEDAMAVRKNAEIEHGYHENHGRMS